MPSLAQRVAIKNRLPREIVKRYLSRAFSLLPFHFSLLRSRKLYGICSTKDSPFYAKRTQIQKSQVERN
jgi:hypothetical protein